MSSNSSAPRCGAPSIHQRPIHHTSSLLLSLVDSGIIEGQSLVHQVGQPMLRLSIQGRDIWPPLFFDKDRTVSVQGQGSPLHKFKEVFRNSKLCFRSRSSPLKLSWSGICRRHRAQTWLLLARVLPLHPDRHVSVLYKRVQSYWQLVHTQYDMSDHDPQLLATLRQIQLDVPRTNPHCGVVQNKKVQQILERVLYVWAVRNPAVSYVQGLNDMCTPMLYVFLANEFDGNFDKVDIDALSNAKLEEIEACIFYVFSRICDDIQDNYIFSQPGIQRMLYRLEELIKRIDAKFHKHLQEQGLEFVQFAFRWFNCFLTREMPLEHIVRIWDSYLADEDGSGFSQFHIYVCAALLMRFSNKLKELEFQDMLLFLQNPPTNQLASRDIDSILSQAFVYKSLFENAKAHLQQ